MVLVLGRGSWGGCEDSVSGAGRNSIPARCYCRIISRTKSAVDVQFLSVKQLSVARSCRSGFEGDPSHPPTMVAKGHDTQSWTIKMDNKNRKGDARLYKPIFGYQI